MIVGDQLKKKNENKGENGKNIIERKKEAGNVVSTCVNSLLQEQRHSFNWKFCTKYEYKPL